MDPRLRGDDGSDEHLPDRATLCYPRRMADLPALADALEEYELLDADDRYRMLIDLGRALDPMPDPLKTDATLVRGCSAAVWVYPTVLADGRLHFLADSNAAITKGIIALVLLTVQDRQPADILAIDIDAALATFDLRNQLSSNRTQGIPNMIALIKVTAERYAGK
jgi:cysteine desulfuration protein SufE